MSVKNRSNSEHYVWAEVCDGWRILDGEDLSVIEERMPPSTSEVRHIHGQANQLFYVLQGALVIEVDGTCFHLAKGDACNVRPGQEHQARNESSAPVQFLVISAPTTREDRQPC